MCSSYLFAQTLSSYNVFFPVNDVFGYKRIHTCPSTSYKEFTKHSSIFLCIIELEFILFSFSVLLFVSFAGCLKYSSYLQTCNLVFYNSNIFEFLEFAKIGVPAYLPHLSTCTHRDIHTAELYQTGL